MRLFDAAGQSESESESSALAYLNEVEHEVDALQVPGVPSHRRWNHSHTPLQIFGRESLRVYGVHK